MYGHGGFTISRLTFYSIMKRANNLVQLRNRSVNLFSFTENYAMIKSEQILHNNVCIYILNLLISWVSRKQIDFTK